MIRDGRSTKSAADMSRKEIKGPDHFQVAAAGASEWMAQNRKALGAAVGVVAVFLVAGLVVNGYLKSSRDAAGGLLYGALDAADGAISSVPLPGMDRPVFTSAEAQQRAVLAAADRTRKEHAGTRAATTAALTAGAARLRLREWEPALADFQAYLSATAAGDSMRFAALDGLARALEGKGDLEGAARAFERAGQEVAFYKDRAVLERARVLQQAGKAEEARKLLAAFPEEFKDSTLKAEAAGSLALLGAK